MGIVQAQHGQAIERKVVQEFNEALFEQLEVTAVRDQVVIVNVGNNSNKRLQMCERCVALVSFGDEIAARTQARVGSGALQASTDDESWIFAALGEDAGNQAGRRRLAVCARNRDGIAEAHELAEHLGPGDHRNPLVQSGVDLRVASGDCARDDHNIGTGNIFRRMTDRNPGADPAQGVG